MVSLIVKVNMVMLQNKRINQILTAITVNIQLHKLASGLDVGLPEGQMGNSEVGHMNIGAGRIVYQSLTSNKSIADGDFFENDVLNNACNMLMSMILHYVFWITI